ncbi:MFS transporter [Roseococcus sp. SYP-B2431]|uniref:MFS transporter n=1 Tax=Roseococcus sp. SYP-B2431 TaxID=2496640 RepID=UPI001040C398|nr:MFS transporter [Roseococcus sp. SYP-B2431]TCH97071.1 MFS transporter [Roseococcus sp. SYP-B2431]
MKKSRVVLILGTTQTLAWAGSYYLPAILAPAMARDTGVSTATVFVAFSCAMLISAVLGPRVGAAIDRQGGRGVLAASNLVFASGLAILSLAGGPVLLFAGWLAMGIAMGMGLYEAGFATLARLYGKEARSAITGITLIAGFASTVGWPLTAAMEAEWGWRGACLGWIGIQLLLALPLNLLLPRPGAREVAAPKPLPQAAARATRRSAILMAAIFSVSSFTAAALGAHLPALLLAAGATPAAAIAAGALLGPAQVGARVLEFTLLRKAHPLLSAKLAQISHPVAAALLLAFGAPAAMAFAVIHGAGNGILTIVRGTLPLAVFGAAGYGARQGLIVAPGRFLSALAPAVFGFFVEGYGVAALWLTIGLSVAAFIGLYWLRVQPESEEAPR